MYYDGMPDGLEYDLGELDKLLGTSEDEKLREEKMKEIKDKI